MSSINGLNTDVNPLDPNSIYYDPSLADPSLDPANVVDDDDDDDTNGVNGVNNKKHQNDEVNVPAQTSPTQINQDDQKQAADVARKLRNHGKDFV